VVSITWTSSIPRLALALSNLKCNTQTRIRCCDGKTNQQLQPEERLTIASMHLQGSSMRAMARMLGRSPATVSRELARNCRFDSYASLPAQALSVARRIAGRPPAKLDPQGVTWRIVLTLLDWKWSPQQISGTLRRMYPDDPSQQVSHETVVIPA
jgi:IS30 family transposase